MARVGTVFRFGLHWHNLRRVVLHPGNQIRRSREDFVARSDSQYRRGTVGSVPCMS